MNNGFIIELHPGMDPLDILRALKSEVPSARVVRAPERAWVVGSGSISPEVTAGLPPVRRSLNISAPYPLASREFQAESTEVRVGAIVFGRGSPVIIAGPCSVESRTQVLSTARHLAARGCQMFRGGAFKPRTSPYSFQGLARDGLALLAEARELTGMPIVTEVLDPGDVELVASCADMLQIGARNMQNFPLLREVGRSMKPVLLKRAPWASVSAWLQAAEYLLVEGNFQIVLCERGIVASENASGRHLDLAALVQLRKKTHLPVVIDPSHGTGDRNMVVPLALAALLLGTDGLLVEVHPDPAAALSDGFQSLDFAGFDELIWLHQRLQQITPKPRRNDP
jgi:3-deoxy-7-phosphoheptulonate synthase